MLVCRRGCSNSKTNAHSLSYFSPTMVSMSKVVILVSLLVGNAGAFLPGWTTKATTFSNQWRGDRQHRQHNNERAFFASRLPIMALMMARKSITLPLLDLSGSDIVDKVIVPLPSSHLPDELTTLNLYGMELSRPVHKMLIEEAIQKGNDLGTEGRPKERAFGYVVYKPTDDSLIGATGCAAEVLVQAARRDATDVSELGMDAPIAVLYRGCYRFVVKEIIRSIPYPVAIVDELVDDDINPTNDLKKIAGNANEEEEDDDDDDDDDLEVYKIMSVGQLNQRIMQSLKTMIDQRLEEVANNGNMNPLEQSILESANMFVQDKASQEEQAEEAAAVFDVFASSLMDIAPSRHEQSYAIAMMAAEIASFDNEMRKKIIITRNSVERLQLACKHVEDMLRMKQARKVATSITDSGDESSKDLKVGPPKLPPWASQIRKGTRIEYYWNEEWEWSPGEVVEEPVKIMDELLLKVKFDADGEVHTLPLNPDEKLRWRPISPKR